MSKRRKILILKEQLLGGGAEKVLSTMLKYIDSSKFDITLCCVNDRGQYVDIIRPYVNYTYILPNSAGYSGLKLLLYKLKYKAIYKWLPLSWVYRLYVPKDADVEVAFVEGFDTKLLSHSTNRHAKKIAWVHIDLDKFHWTDVVYKNAEEEKQAYSRYDQIVTVSETARRAIQKIYPDLKTPVQTLYNPIDSDEIRRKASARLQLPVKRRLRLVSIGRLTRQKAYDRLLRIMKKLKDEKYDIELWILGDGLEQWKLQQYITENQLDNCVTLWGFQQNPYAFLPSCDLFVCSSISEGYSTAVTEALIVGLPVITTDCSGMAELLKDGECGVITENSEEALYEGLKKLLDTPGLIASYKEKAVSRGNEFTLPALMKPIENLLLS